MSSSVAIDALVGWMLLFTLKHVLADFVLQNQWMAYGKDGKTGWGWPLLAHCLIHGGLTTAMMAAVAPAFWFIGLIDFAFHIVLDRVKGFFVARYDVTTEDRWFWWLIGVDQALHHLTGFGFSVFLAVNA